MSVNGKHLIRRKVRTKMREVEISLHQRTVGDGKLAMTTMVG
jgi:hypothetical protein